MEEGCANRRIAWWCQQEAVAFAGGVARSMDGAEVPVHPGGEAVVDEGTGVGP